MSSEEDEPMKTPLGRRNFLQSLGLAFPLTQIVTTNLFGRGRSEFEIGAVGESPVIITKLDTPLVRTVNERLRGYLGKLTGEAPRMVPTPSGGRCQILLGDAAMAKEYGVACPHADAESFTLAPLMRDRHPFLVISGQSEQGVKRGVYYLMQNLILKRDKLIVSDAVVESRPFFAGRGSALGGYVRQVFNLKNPNESSPEILATAEQLAWNQWTYWEPERVSEYIDMLDFFGYNLIETAAAGLMPKKRASPEEQAKVARRRDALVDSIRRNGMQHRVFFNGTLFREDDNKGERVPYGPDTHHLYEEYFRRTAEAVAPYADSVLTHWLDDGAWKSTPAHPCTIEVLQELHMQIHRAFKKVNPQIQSVLSLWALDEVGPGTDNLGWQGYEGVDSILKSGLVPPEVGLAMSGKVRMPEARKITAAGHPASAWGWYLADNELVYTMHAHTHVLADYLHSLPEEARDLVGLHTLDNCQAETNLYSVYVGVRMLADPHGDPERYLREVARLVYGPKGEEPVFRGLKAIADVRCGKTCCGYWNPKAEPGFETSRDEPPGNGNASVQASNGILSFDRALELATEAWAGLKGFEIDHAYTPPIRFHRPTETLLQELKGHVEAVATYMQFLKDRKTGKQRPTEVPSAQGPFEYYERMEYLHPGEVFWPATVFLPK
jgi:hypothetical protein